jgi:hypothetical protein
VNVEAQPAFPTNIVVTLNQKGQVSLAWDRAASHSNVTFCVLIGVKSGVYNVRQDAGTNVTTVVTNLSPSLYFFTVIAKNQAGLESDPSNEVSYEVTKPLAPSGIRTTQINTQLESSMFPEGPWTKILSYQPTSFMVSSDHRFFRARLMIDVGQIIHE